MTKLHYPQISSEDYQIFRMFMLPGEFPERAGLSSLKEGQKVKYEIARDRGKDSAANLSLVE